MPKKNIKDLKSSKAMKDIGVTDIEQEGGRVSLTLDTSKMSSRAKRSIASSLPRAAAAVMWNNPLEPTYFDPNYGFDTMSTHDKMKMAMQYFSKDPLVGKIIEMMKTFANDGFKNEHPDPEIKAFYDNWCKSVDMDLVLGWIFLEYFVTGNVPVLRELIPYSEDNFKFPAPQYSVDGSSHSANAAKKYRYTKKAIPAGYTVINPLVVRVEDPNTYSEKLVVSTKDIKIKGNSLADPSDLNISSFNDEKIKKAVRVDPSVEDKRITRILRMRQPYEPYGRILMERAFAALYEKNKLRQMDMAMVNSVINQIIKVTIGNDEYPATPRQLKNLAEAFQNVGKSQVIFWNHTLNVEVIRPDTKVLNMEKYDRVNEDIRNAFGISEVIMGGGTSKTNFATAYLTLKVFIANLTDARKDVSRWLRGQYADIAEAMGFDSYPEPTFNNLSMTDEVAEKQLIMQMVDRGIISYQSAQSRLGYDPQIEIARKKQEKPLVEQGLLGFAGSPYQQQAIDKEDKAIDTNEESDKNVLKEDKQTADDMAKKENQQNRNHTKNVGDPGRKVPMRGEDGRPKTPVGKKMPNRKIAKIKGQGSLEQQDLPLSEQDRKDIILKIAKEKLGK